ncbi:MAG: M48 family metallopeptidase [Candidatus Pacearchaeota archaeon]
MKKKLYLIGLLFYFSISSFIFSDSFFLELLKGVTESIKDIFGLDPAKDLKKMVSRSSSEWEDVILRSEVIDTLYEEFGSLLFGPLIKKSFLQEKCQEIAEKIIKYTPYPDLPIQVRLINNPIENAFTTGGKYIYIYTGLISNINSEDALAFVISHEIGHIMAGHLIRQEKGNNFGALMVILTKPKSQQQFENVFKIVNARYSQDFEREADVLGAVFSYLAGYDIEEGAKHFLEMWKKEEIEKQKLLLTNPTLYQQKILEEMFFATHPPLPERIKLIKQTKRFLENTEDTHPLMYVLEILREINLIKKGTYFEYKMDLDGFIANMEFLSIFNLQNYGFFIDSNVAEILHSNLLDLYFVINEYENIKKLKVDMLYEKIKELSQLKLEYSLKFGKSVKELNIMGLIVKPLNCEYIYKGKNFMGLVIYLKGKENFEEWSNVVNNLGQPIMLNVVTEKILYSVGENSAIKIYYNPVLNEGYLILVYKKFIKEMKSVYESPLIRIFIP